VSVQQVTVTPPPRAEPKVSLRQSGKVQSMAGRESSPTPAVGPPALRVSRKVKPAEVTPPLSLTTEVPNLILPVLTGKLPPSPAAKQTSGCKLQR